MSEIPERKARLYAISLSLMVGSMVMAVKFYAYWLTDSSALLSDALESIINVVASAFALWSILFSERPPDHSHPYGHGKVEYFSAGFEGALIIIAACGIFLTAWPRIVNPQEIFQLDKGLVLLALTGVVNLMLSLGLDLCREEDPIDSAHGRWKTYHVGCAHHTGGIRRPACRSVYGLPVAWTEW